MTAIPLFTSIPPSVSRRDENGNEIGAAYQESCIRSWIAAGFKPYSVNGPDDVVPFPELVEVIRVPRTAKELHGKPVVFIADLFAAAHAVTPGPVMIINADIMLRPEFELADHAANLRADAALIARRIDVKHTSSTSGDLQTHGFDIFAAHAAQFIRIPDAGFALGLPWWDFYVPMALNGLGVAVTLVTEPVAYHLTHKVNWSQANFVKFGVLYAEYGFAIFAACEPLRAHSLLCTKAMEKWRSARRLHDMIPHAIESRFPIKISRDLDRPVRKALTEIGLDALSRLDKHQRHLEHRKLTPAGRALLRIVTAAGSMRILQRKRA